MFKNGSMIRSQLKRTVLAFEILERRHLLTASFPTQGWQSALFDEGVAGDLEFSFSRDVPTIDFNGSAVATNQPRFAAEKLVTDTHHWIQILPQISKKPWTVGSGWDHDGTTPLAVVVAYPKIYFVRGDAFSVENAFTYGDDLLRGTVSGYRYSPKAVVVHEGLVVFQALRERSEDGEWIREGISFFSTQDYGQTIERVAQVGGGFDVPSLENNVADGKMSGRPWAFSNSFPEKSSTDLLGAWFPWADYIRQRDNPKGGQIGLFRARRPEVGQPWVIEPNRLVFERWEPSDTGGLHSHSAGMFDDGLVSFWGDVDDRNHMARHIATDLENYTTTTWTHNTEFNGAWSPGDDKVYRIGNQAASVAPGPNFGEVLVTGDEQPELIMKIQRPDDPNGTAIIRNQKGSFSGARYTGSMYTGRISLEIHHLRDRGYVVEETWSKSQLQQISAIHYSVDGEIWTTLLNHDKGYPRLYGDSILQAASNGIYAAVAPGRTEVFSPLAISPGGTNLSNTTWDELIPPSGSNTFRAVEFNGSEYRYADSGELVLPQPVSSPPVMGTTPIFEVTAEGSSKRLGKRNASDIPSNEGQPHRMDMWYYNLSGDGISPSMRFTDSWSPAVSRWVTNNEWVNGFRISEPAPGSTSETERFVQMSIQFSPSPQRWLMAPGGLVEHHSPTYPLAPESTGPHELATVSGFQIVHDWTIGLVFGIPELGGFAGWLGTTGSDAVHPIATLRQDPNNYIEVGHYRLDQWNQFIVLDVYSDGAFVERLEFSDLSVDFEDRLQLVVSGSEEGLGASLLVPRYYVGVQSKTMDELPVIRPQEVLLSSNAAQDVVSTLEWYAVQVLPDQALTTQEREAFVISDEIFSPAVGAPQVTSVKVGSTDWHPDFVSWVDPLAQLGYSIHGGNSQQTPLPWSNINQVFIQFSEDVQIGASDIQLTGINAQDYGTQGSFHYDQETLTAIITLDSPLQADQVHLLISENVTDFTGRSLDGEWIDQHTDFSSGDGTAGGDFTFNFNVLPGDVSRDGILLPNDSELATSALSTTVGDGEYSIYSDLNGDGTVLGSDLEVIQLAPLHTLPDVPVGSGPPRVQSVKVRSTTWSGDFVSLVDPIAKIGYAVPTGTAQSSPLPWENIDQVSITFSDDVQINLADIQLTGITTSEYTVTEVNYDDGSRTATLTLNKPIEADRLQLVIADSVTNPSGEALDGEWPPQGSNFESGNGIAGDSFVFDFNVLPGDISQDNYVLGNDFTLATNARLSDYHDPHYSVVADLDGSATVLENDVLLALQHQFTTLPMSAPETASASFIDLQPGGLGAAHPGSHSDQPIAQLLNDAGRMNPDSTLLPSNTSHSTANSQPVISQGELTEISDPAAMENASPSQTTPPVQISLQPQPPTEPLAHELARLLPDPAHQAGLDMNDIDLLTALFDGHDYLAAPNNQPSDAGELTSEPDAASEDNWELVTTAVFEDYFPHTSNED
jgi:methionine-rich copper-binding protein CopC